MISGWMRGKRCAQVGEGDFFWDENGRSQFPKVAEEVDAQLQKYKQVHTPDLPQCSVIFSLDVWAFAKPVLRQTALSALPCKTSQRRERNICRSGIACVLSTVSIATLLAADLPCATTDEL